jgi:hypothetical protein
VDFFIFAESESGTHTIVPISFSLSVHVSRDAHDLVILASNDRLLLVPDFESICREETTLEETGYVLRIPSEEDVFFYLGFEHGRVCVATVRNLLLRAPIFELFS